MDEKNLPILHFRAPKLDDLVARSQPHFSGKSSRLRRLDEDAGLLDGALEVDNP